MRIILLLLLLSPALAALPVNPAPKQTGNAEESLHSFLEKVTTDRYLSAPVDLKEDGTHQFVVYLADPQWCGTGGCTLLILEPKDASYRIISEITIAQLPIRILATKTNGWHDIGVWVEGGGIEPGYEAILTFDGQTYPGNPSMVPERRTTQRIEGKVVVSSQMLAKLVKKGGRPTHYENIVPGQSVGNLRLGMKEADLQQAVFSWQPSAQISRDQDACHYRFISWVNTDGNYPVVEAYLADQGIVEVTVTTEPQTVQGIGPIYGKKLKDLKSAIPDGELFRWRGSDFRMPSQRDEFFWVARSRGISFGLDYDRKLKTRTVISVTIFKPETTFQPGGCHPDADELVPATESQDR